MRRTTTSVSKVVDEQGETALVELLFEVCTKIRLNPEILPAWFYPERIPGKTLSALEARRSQFPLFYLLVEYVHYDGPIGDFARTALLYLTETAAKSRPLEKWMMESDLAHQMASGLSALYGRLGRQAPNISKRALPILSFSDMAETKDELDGFYEDAGMDMRAFLSYLAFWQDTLSHCKSLEVRDTLLDTFQVLFVEQLLYPSLLESSDVEGGSTSAVILHLCRLLDAVDQPQLVNRMLSYLFATKSQPAVAKNQRARNRMSMSRRRSVEQLATLASLADNPSPEFFSLLDLIVFSLRSTNAQTVSASLKLITVLLRRHHPHVKYHLLSLEVLRPGSKQNLNGLNNTMMTLFDFAGAISNVSTMDQSYQAALKDVQSSMERHSCLLDENVDVRTQMDVMAVSSQCKVVDQLTNLLESWFANDTLVNLELTGALAGLSACEHVLMRSWLTPIDSAQASIVAIIGQLINQVKAWRLQFVEWDAFYSIQKVELASEDELFSLGRQSTVYLSEKDTSATIDAPSQALAKKLARMEVGSLGSRVVSDGSTAAEFGISRQVSDGSAGQRSEASTKSSGTLSATLLETRIPIIPSSTNNDKTDGTIKTETEISEGRAVEDESAIVEDSESEKEERQTASLRHVLTQAIMLQEFILELAAALQIRATLFDEVELS